RLTPSGQLDSKFGSGGIAVVPVGSAAIANGVAIQSNGDIVLGGMTTTDANHFVAARLTPSGALDSSFGSGGITVLAPVGAAWGVGIEGNGSIVLGGQATQSDGTQAYMAAMLTPWGTPVANFGTSGVAIVPV